MKSPLVEDWCNIVSKSISHYVGFPYAHLSLRRLAVSILVLKGSCKDLTHISPLTPKAKKKKKNPNRVVSLLEVLSSVPADGSCIVHAFDPEQKLEIL